MHEISLLLLKGVFVIILFIPLYSVFYAMCENIAPLFILPAVSFTVIVLFTIKNNYPMSHIYLRINKLNPHMRNYYFTYYEMLQKDISISRKTMPEIGSYLKDKQFILFSKNEYKRIYLLICAAIMINLIAIGVIPRYYGLAWGMIRKGAVIESQNGSMSLHTFNLGGIRGEMKIRSDGNITDMEDYSGSNTNAWVFFKGPRVKSNELKLAAIRNITADSVIVNVKPPPYTGMRETVKYGNSIEVPEFSDMFISVFYGNAVVNDSVFRIGAEDSVVEIISENGICRLKIALKKDMHPYVSIIADENALWDNIIKIPYMTFDDFGIDKTGAMIVSHADTQYIYAKDISDTLFIISFVRKKNRDYIVTCFTKDNNPFRNQTTYSQPLLIGHYTAMEKRAIAADSLNALSETIDDMDNMIERMEYARNSITQMQNKPDIKSYNETVSDIRKLTEQVNKQIEQIARYDADKEILKNLYEIRKKMDDLDREMLKELFPEMDLDKLSFKELKDAREFIKNNSDQIIQQLKQLQSMLDKLADMGMLMKTDAQLEGLIEKQENIAEGDSKQQEEITKGLKEADDALNDYPTLNKIKKSLKDAAEMSQRAEKNPGIKDDVKQSMESIRQQINEMMSSMSNQQTIDAQLMLLGLGMINRQTLNGDGREGILAAYTNLKAYAVNKGGGEQLARLFENGRNIVLTAERMDTIINYNLYIAAYLLNMNTGQGQGESMTLQQMMQSMQGMNRKQSAISQMLTEMLERGESGQDMLDEMARMQKDMSSMMRQMSQQSSGKTGGQLEELADSLDVLIEALKDGINNELSDREKHLLNRMLEFSKSVYKQGLSDKRESETGSRVLLEPIVQPAGLSGYGVQWTEIMKGLEAVESVHYRTVIRKYFMEIMK